MATKPKKRQTKKTTRLSKPDHLPALSPAQLTLTLQKLDKLPIPAPAKQAVSDSLKAARNPNAERADVVVKTLPLDEKKNVKRAQAAYATTLDSPIERGKAALLSLSDAEWQRLVDGIEQP